MVGDVAGEDAGGDADAIDYNNEVEGFGVRHAYYVSREGRNLMLTLAVTYKCMQESYIVEYEVYSCHQEAASYNKQHIGYILDGSPLNDRSRLPWWQPWLHKSDNKRQCNQIEETENTNSPTKSYFPKQLPHNYRVDETAY